tara:strand:- start:4674 stop:5018 length:345 start_codon:yes stop_codon:yes gene_type:complete
MAIVDVRKTKGLHELTVQEAENAQLGQGGYKFIDQAGTANTGTAAAGVEYVAVTVLEDKRSSDASTANIATESNDQSLWPDTTFNAVPGGTTIYGRWNKVTISGTDCTAICYRG